MMLCNVSFQSFIKQANGAIISLSQNGRLRQVSVDDMNTHHTPKIGQTEELIKSMSQAIVGRGIKRSSGSGSQHPKIFVLREEQLI
jgi:hypothetical protein